MTLCSVTAFSQPVSEWTALVDRNLHIYSIVTDRRDAGETAVLKGNTPHIRYRRDLRRVSPEQRNQFMCDAARWMLAGRRDSSPGLKRLLTDTPIIQSVKFVAYAVDTSVTLNRKGRYDQNRKLLPQMILSVDRKRVAEIDAEKAGQNLRGTSCAKVARALLTQVWLEPL